MSRTIGSDLYGDLVEVASKEGFGEWLSMVRATGGCANPIHLWGESTTLDLSTGEVLRQREPGRLLVACGNRRASRCRSCSETYRADTYQLIRAGLVGGKNAPESVRSHPRVFATFTAPSFGPVHNCVETDSAGYGPCHPHGTLSCGARHGPDDPLLGQPLDPSSYDYANAVMWNALATQLWPRTVQLANRQSARFLRISQRDWPSSGRVSVAKVAEFQARGLVHFHAIFRLDGPQPGNDPPAGATAEILTNAIRFAAGSAKVTPPLPNFLPVVWGEQLDVRTVDGDMRTDTQVAGYIAKYATKGAGAAGTVEHPLACQDCAGLGRLPEDEAPRCHRCRGTGLRYDLHFLQVSAHARAMIDTCWSLGGRPELEHLRLRPWAHMLGFRGHFSTKSRRYSTTLTKLRSARSEWRNARILQSLGGTESTTVHRADDDHDAAAETIVTVGHWQYLGRGHTAGQALYAMTIAEDMAEERRLARLAPLDEWEEPA
jgi:Replication initiator protein, pSAM2